MANFKALEISSKDLITVDADEAVGVAHRRMKEKKIRHLVVTEGGKAMGMLSDRDVMKALRVEIEDLYDVEARVESHDPNMRVRDIMGWPIKKVEETASITEVIDRMLQDKISSLLVTNASNEVTGIVTTDDLLVILKHHLAGDQKNFWGSDVINQAYANTPVRSVLEILSNTGI